MLIGFWLLITSHASWIICEKDFISGSFHNLFHYSLLHISQNTADWTLSDLEKALWKNDFNLATLAWQST